MIYIVKYPSNSEFSANLQQEVFEFGSNSAFDSGLFDTLTKAQQFASKIITDAFKLNPDNQYFFAVFSDNNMVGCAWLMDKSCSESPDEIRLSYIRIDPAHQRKGIARKAIQLLEEYAIKGGFMDMSLNVFSNIPHAKQLYEQIGFNIIHETEKGNKVVTTEMKKILVPQI